MRIKYIDNKMPKLAFIENKNNWIDVMASKVIINGVGVDWVDNKVFYKNGDYLLVKLGFALELRRGYEAHIKPRSSTFKNFGLIQVNGVGTIDETYNGDDDEWFIPFLAMRDGVIERWDRVGQFRLFEVMDNVIFEEVGKLGNKNRGGYGSTGKGVN